MNLNFAVKDAIGGWKDNAHIIRTPKACTSLKVFLGTRWPEFVKSFGIKSTNCPISSVSCI